MHQSLADYQRRLQKIKMRAGGTEEMSKGPLKGPLGEMRAKDYLTVMVPVM